MFKSLRQFILIVIIGFIFPETLWAIAGNGEITFSGFNDDGNNLTSTDFILSGTRNNVVNPMDKDGSIAFGTDIIGGSPLSCVYRLEVDGTNTGSFELQGIRANEFKGTGNTTNYTRVKLIGIKLDSSEINSDNIINGTNNFKDSYNTVDFGLTQFAGVQLTAIEIQYDSSGAIGAELCSLMDFNSFTITNAQAPATTKTEPTNHPTNFTPTTNSTTQITTAWTDATGTVTPDTYLVMCNKTGNFTPPVDTTVQVDDTNCSDGSGVQNITHGTSTVAWTGLDGGTQYFFNIFPFTNTGSDVNYKTNPIPETKNATTTVLINADATLTPSSSITEPVDLPTTANNSNEAVNLFDFTLTDGGGSDGLSTDVTQLIFHTSGTGDFSKVTWRLNGADANQVAGVYNPSDNTLTFSGLNLSIADGNNETYTLNGFFNDNTSITDNHTYLFSIDGASNATNGSDVTVDPNKTQMAADSIDA